MLWTNDIHPCLSVRLTHEFPCRSQELILLCDFILNSSQYLPAEQALYHTLVRLYLAADNDELKATQHNPVVSSSIQSRRLSQRRWHHTRNCFVKQCWCNSVILLYNTPPLPGFVFVLLLRHEKCCESFTHCSLNNLLYTAFYRVEFDCEESFTLLRRLSFEVPNWGAKATITEACGFLNIDSIVSILEIHAYMQPSSGEWEPLN